MTPMRVHSWRLKLPVNRSVLPASCRQQMLSSADETSAARSWGAPSRCESLSSQCGIMKSWRFSIDPRMRKAFWSAAASDCSLHESLATGVAERLADGSRGLQPTVARGENPRRGATLERPHLPTIQASLRDSDPFGPPPWAEAHGYSRSSLRDETEPALPDSCKEQGKRSATPLSNGLRCSLHTEAPSSLRSAGALLRLVQ